MKQPDTAAARDRAKRLVKLSKERDMYFTEKDGTRAEGSMTARYPGDKIKVTIGREKRYRVNCYDAFQHTWTIANTGTVEWRERRLFLTNSADIKLKVESTYLDVPTLGPGDEIKIATGIEARGKEDTAEYQWIMIDKDGNNCFPEDRSLFITVTVEFQPLTGK